MRISAQRLAVEAAEQQVQTLHADAAKKSRALKTRAQRRWLPAALLGVGGLIGFWLDGRLNSSSSDGQKKPSTSEPASEASSSPVTPALSALATASMLLKLWHDFAPLAEHFMQRSSARASSKASGVQSAASEPSQVPDATSNQR